jgi:hypothetical protein
MTTPRTKAQEIVEEKLNRRAAFEEFYGVRAEIEARASDAKPKKSR